MTINGKKTVQVAIAVLVFGEQLLLATRKSGQHQGGKLEFIGGKIEPNETPVQALMRRDSPVICKIRVAISSMDISETFKLGIFWVV